MAQVEQVGGESGAAASEVLLLLVEDNLVNQKLALRQLQHIGYRAETVSNGREAVEAVASGRYALVLMDCQMPVMDGYDATRAIRRAEEGTARRIPIVAMTANAIQGDREKCLEAGMDDYLAKPVRLADLQRVVEHWLTRAAEAAQKSGAVTDELPAAGSRQGMVPGVSAPMLATLRELGLDEEPELLDDLLATYFAEVPKLLGRMRQALTTADAQTMRRAAHTLKSSSAHLGASQLAALCWELESSFTEADLTQGCIPQVAGVLAERIAEEYERARVALLAVRSALVAPCA